MRDLPSGTVTFLFTDIEGSTRLLHELGEAYADALAEHRRLLREAFARHGGVEVDTQGDAFFVAFASAREAVFAANEAQQALASGPLRVRMGLHTGEPQLTDEGYVGLEVHKGARIAAAAHGGQVVVSRETSAQLDDVFELLDLGEHRVKNFSEPVWIYQLGEERFPPLKTISNTNLPRPASSFVGREREVVEVVSLLRDGARLITLSGPGGSGKTRLAIEAAADVVPEFKNGVFWVGLASIRDPALVTDTVAQTLGARNGLAEHVGERELLLLLDNFEQVVDAAPDLSALLSGCPNLRLLVTSRELLRVQGEVEYPVPPPAEPEAVELFCTRSRLAPSEEIAELCRRLDDLPLAVELAAARTSVFSPKQIVERLSQRLDLLKGGRDTEARQQTLRATIEWSYDLLSPEEQRVFARLAVFADCTLEAAEAVCGADVDTLQSLVEKSLLRHTEERFWMLETIREYAAGRLQESDEAGQFRRRHAEFFLALADSANLRVERFDAGERHELVIPEADNLRAALDWALATEEIELGMSIVLALEQYWVTNSPREGARRVGDFLERFSNHPSNLRARALRTLGGTTYIMGDFEEGNRWAEEALAEFRRLDDQPGIAHLLFRLAVEANRVGDRNRARALCEESLSLDRSKSGEAQVLRLLGDIAFNEGRSEEALELTRRSAQLAGEAGFRWWQYHALQAFAEYALKLGKPDEARTPAREGLAGSRLIGDRQGIIYGLALLAWLAVERDRLARAGLLWGALEAETERALVGQWESDQDDFAGRIVIASSAFERGREEGRKLSLDEAVEEALRRDPGS